MRTTNHHNERLTTKMGEANKGLYYVRSSFPEAAHRSGSMTLTKSGERLSMSLHESARVEIQALLDQIVSIYLDLARLSVIDEE